MKNEHEKKVMNMKQRKDEKCAHQKHMCTSSCRYKYSELHSNIKYILRHMQSMQG